MNSYVSSRATLFPSPFSWSSLALSLSLSAGSSLQGSADLTWGAPWLFSQPPHFLGTGRLSLVREIDLRSLHVKLPEIVLPKLWNRHPSFLAQVRIAISPHGAKFWNGFIVFKK